MSISYLLARRAKSTPRKRFLGMYIIFMHALRGQMRFAHTAIWRSILLISTEMFVITPMQAPMWKQEENQFFTLKIQLMVFVPIFLMGLGRISHGELIAAMMRRLQLILEEL